MPASPNPRPVYGPSVPLPTVTDPSSPTWRDVTEHNGRTFVTVAIGRNVHSDPSHILSASAWSQYRRRVSDLFASVDFVVDGQSSSFEHGTEETFIVGGWVTFPTVARRSLASLVGLFDQDAASWCEGGDRITPADR